MGEKTGIEWTDATVNFWWGCTKVGPGCDHCYAEKWSKRTGGDHWGVGAPRRKIKSAVALLHRLDNDYAWWAADHYIAGAHSGGRRKVFIQSMSDLFDLEVPLEWFDEAWRTIHACDRIDVQIVTKRVSAVEKRIQAIKGSWPKHAGLLVTITSQHEADRDVPRVLELKKHLGIPWVGLSIEPLLAPVDLTRIDNTDHGFDFTNALNGMRCLLHPHASGEPQDIGSKIDWVIVGGESGKDARPMHPDWARALRDQCHVDGVAFFFKQWGEWAPGDAIGVVQDGPVTDSHGNVKDWLRRYVVRADRADRVDAHSFTGHSTDLVYRVGKKAAGRLLDGREWSEFPAGAGAA